MTLLTAVLAAVVTTVLWYFKDGKNHLKLGTLSLIYWGASLMWLADAIFEFLESEAAYFSPAPQEMLNDCFLGISAVTLGLVIWLVLLLVSDPDGVIRNALSKKH